MREFRWKKFPTLAMPLATNLDRPRAMSITLTFVLTLVMAGSFVSCSRAKHDIFTHKAIVQMAQDLDVDEYEYFKSIYDDVSSMSTDANGYFSVTGHKAQQYYDLLVNRMRNFGDYEISEFTVIAKGEKGQNYVFFMTFADEDDAGACFEEYLSYGEWDDDGTTDDYSYAVRCNEVSSDRTNIRGVYLHGDKLLITISITKNLAVAESIYEYLGVESPLD